MEQLMAMEDYPKVPFTTHLALLLRIERLTETSYVEAGRRENTTGWSMECSDLATVSFCFSRWVVAIGLPLAVPVSTPAEGQTQAPKPPC